MLMQLNILHINTLELRSLCTDVTASSCSVKNFVWLYRNICGVLCICFTQNIWALRTKCTSGVRIVLLGHIHDILLSRSCSQYTEQSASYVDILLHLLSHSNK